MKTFLTTCFLFLTGFAVCQSENIDEGFADLSVNTAKSEIKQELTIIDTAQLWEPVKNTMFVTATVAVNGSLTYFDLDVARIEIQLQDSHDEQGGENIYQLTVFLERPTEERYYEFYEQVFETFGPALTYSIDMDKGTESPNWFTDITLMTVSSYDNYVVHNKKKYVTITYMQGYGG